MQHFPLLVSQDYSADEKHEVVAPFDNQPIATFDCANWEAIDNALATAHALYRDRDQWLSVAERIQILEKVADLMTEQQDQLALQAAHEGGKPLIDSQVEAARAIDGIKICIETLRTEQGKVIPMRYNAASSNRIAFTQKEPIGVVVAVSAFNHPLNLIVHQVAAAVASGCPVIVKPASDTPISCFNLVKIFHAAGLPVEWCQALLVKDNELAGKMVADPRLGFFSFIGSARVGWSLRSTLAPGVRCALEHGGVAPVIMLEDADLKQAIPLLSKGGFYHAGQVCVSVQRVFAHKSIADQVANQLAESAKQLKVGDPTLDTTEVGPLIRPDEVDRVAGWVEEAVAADAQLLCGGEKISETCYAPTVLLNPPQSAMVSQAEVFGPVVCVYAYADLDQAINLANSLPFAFQAAVFTQQIDPAIRVSSRLDAAAVMVNDHTAFRVDGMPFAGLRHSGLGIGGIPHTMHDMQIEKLLVIKSNEI